MPPIATASATLSERYDALVAEGTLERNPAQEGAVAALEALARRMTQRAPSFGLTQLLDRSVYLGMVAAFGGALSTATGEFYTLPESLESRRAMSRLIEMRAVASRGLGATFRFG